MKKSTKFISLLLSVVLAVSTFAGIAVVPVSAADEEQLVYFQFPDESVWTHSGLKINARSGVANVYCYAYAIAGNTKKYKLGWKTRTTQCNAVAQDGQALIDSTLFSFNLAGVTKTVDGVKTPLGPIEEGADYGIIFSTAADGQNQTCDLTMATECIGDTVIVTPYNGEATRENAADSHKVDHYAAWKNNTAFGPKATISSLGVLMPGLFPAHQPRPQILSNELKNYLTNPINNPYFQYENNMKLCSDLGVTPKEVYDQYMKDNADYITGEPETDSKVPCPFYRYMYENDQDQIVEGKLAAPDYVKEVLGVTDEEPTTEPVAEPTTEPVEPTTEPVEPTTEPVAEPTTEPVEPTTEPVVEPTTEPVEPTTEPVVEPTTEPVVEPTTEPVEPTTEPVVEPTTEPVVEPTTEPVVEPTTEPAPTDVYSVAGSSAAIFDVEWDGSYTGTEMTCNPETGLYEITFANVEPAESVQFKVLQNHNWDTSYPEENVTFNVTAACDVKITIDPETKEVTVSGEFVELVTDLEVKNVIAVGNGEDDYLNGANWDPADTANALTQVSDGVWEITYEGLPAFDNYIIKFTVNAVDDEGNPVENPWASNFGTEEEKAYPVNTTLDAVWNGKNCGFEVAEDGSDVKFQLDLREFNFTTKTGAKLTITVTEPEVPSVGIIGDVNQDGAVTVLDATLIQQVSVGKVPNSIFNNKLADVNNDGVINILDASCVQRFAAEMTKKIGEAGKAYEDITPASEDPQIMD